MAKQATTCAPIGAFQQTTVDGVTTITAPAGAIGYDTEIWPYTIDVSYGPARVVHFLRVKLNRDASGEILSARFQPVGDARLVAVVTKTP